MRNLNVYATLAVGGYVVLCAQGAAAADWKLVEVNGPVRIATPGGELTVATVGQVLPTGSNVTTGGGGRAALMNGAQRVVVGPNSRMTVAPESNAGMTRVMQDLGSILFQVDKKPSQHFRVETPLLAAVVKGTTFTVTVGPQSDAVHVAEGLVEVRASNGGATQDVPAGATGVVSRDDPQALNVKTPTSDLSAEPAPVAVEPLDYASASGGLVDAAPVGGSPLGQAGQGVGRGGDVAAAGGGESSAETGQGFQSARASVAVMIAARDNGGPAAGANGDRPNSESGNSSSGNGGANTGGASGANGNSGNGNGGGPGDAAGNGGSNAGDASGGAATGNAGNGNSNGNSGNGNSGGSGGGSGVGNSGNGNGGADTGAATGANPGDAGNGASNGASGDGSVGSSPSAANGGSGNGPGGNAANGNSGSNPGSGGGNGNAGPSAGAGNSGNSGGSGGQVNPGNGNGNGNPEPGAGAGNGNGGANSGAGADSPNGKGH